MADNMLESAEQVLHYWFDGNQSVNYKTKWFPTGSKDLQHNADVYVSETFGELLKKAMNHELDVWMDQPKTHLALIIILDQFSRHIFRLENLAPEDPLRKEADAQALKCAEQLFEAPGWDERLSTAEFVFAMMPFRHSATIPRLQMVMGRIDDREAAAREDEELLVKFRKQSTRRLQHLQDRDKATSTDEILERHPFVADETEIMSNPLLISTAKFLSKHCSEQMKEGSTPLRLAVSLSGGVDSMVIAKILVVLRRERIIPSNAAVIALHIDYANRAESAKEADFVSAWCEQMGIIFEKRVIDEVTRGVTDRTAYERISRDIRYGFYNMMLQKYGCSGVMFGHHLGDVQENVISNVFRGSSPIELSGMAEVGVTNGVAVWRPLLAHDKSEIYDFSHRYGVPYLKDTTPSWSTRGKLRNSLIPLLVDLYGEGCLRSLSALATESDEMKVLVENNIYSPFLRSVKRCPTGLSVNVVQYRHQPKVFWKEMLRDLMHSMGMSMVRDKSVGSFMDRLHRGVQSNKSKMRMKRHTNIGVSSASHSQPDTLLPLVPIDDNDGVVPGWIELRKGFFSLLTEDGNLVIFKDNVLGNPSYSSDDSGRIPIDRESIDITMNVGNWHVRINSCCQTNRDSACEACRNASAKILQDPQALLVGAFSYTICVPNPSKCAEQFELELRLLAESIASTDQPRQRQEKKVSKSQRKKQLKECVESIQSLSVEEVAVTDEADFALFDDADTRQNSAEQPSFAPLEAHSNNSIGMDAADADEPVVISKVLDVPAIIGLDTKLKSSLPLLVPVIKTPNSQFVDHVCQSLSLKAKTSLAPLPVLMLRLTYSY